MKLPYIIAEIGLNHGGRVDVARQMIEAAAEAGADAVKFQYVKADTLCAKDSPTYFQQNGEAAKTQWEFFRRSDALTRYDYEGLALHAKMNGIDFGCTVFQPEDVAWVDPLVKWHKVASADIDNWPLHEAVAATGKNIFLSTGAATRRDIMAAIDGPLSRTTADIRVMHCVLEYPTPPEHANLLAVQHATAYSCHVPFNLDVLTTAWLLGAQYIEKHFTLDKTQAGNDHFHSMDPSDLRAFVARCRELRPLLGDGGRDTVPEHEQAARRYARRSWAARGYLAAGTIVADHDLIALRPGTGIPVSEDIMGQMLTVPVPQGHLIPRDALRPAEKIPIISS